MDSDWRRRGRGSARDASGTAIARHSVEVDRSTILRGNDNPLTYVMRMGFAAAAAHDRMVAVENDSKAGCNRDLE